MPRMTRGRRSSIAAVPALSMIPETSGAPSPAAPARSTASTGGGAAASAPLSPASAAGGAVLAHAEAEGAVDAASSEDGDSVGALEGLEDAAAGDEEGLTTKLMQIMDDQGDLLAADADMADALAAEGEEEEAEVEGAPAAGGWAVEEMPRVSIGGGRGSVGSNMIGMTGTLVSLVGLYSTQDA
jgi:hypothetical protein